MPCYKYKSEPKSLLNASPLSVGSSCIENWFLFSVRSCGLLNVPRSTKSSYEYTVGTETTITGCRKGNLEGTTTYTCVETSNVTQEWSPAVTAVCAGIHTFCKKLHYSHQTKIYLPVVVCDN